MQSHSSLIPVTYRAPFDLNAPWKDVREHGETILEIVSSVPNLPQGFIDYGGVACINGEVVPRELWARVKPKPTSEFMPIAVTLHWPLRSPGGSGGGNTTKSIVGLVAALALVVITGGISTGFLATGFGLTTFSAGSLPTLALAGAVGIGGALAISALTAPPSVNPAPQIAPDTNTDNKDPAGAGGNVLSPGGAIPRVIGYRKIFPPLVSEPVIELINTEDEVVEAVYALNGPHFVGDLRIDGVAFSDLPPGVAVEFRDGHLDTSNLTIVNRRGRTTNLQTTLSQHKLKSDDLTFLNNSFDDMPQWHRFTNFGNSAPDEVWVHLLFPSGVMNTANSSIISVPFRLRMRAAGSSDAWINFPEFHFASATAKPMKRQIRIKFSAAPFTGVGTLDGTKRNWWYAHFQPPQQSSTPSSSTTGTDWVSDGYFGTGPGGNAYAFAGVEGSTKLNNMTMSQDGITFWLSSSGGYAAGKWEFELIRGWAYLLTSFNQTTYAYGGNTRDFFGGLNSTLIVAQDQTGFASVCLLIRCISIYNGDVVPTAARTKFALLAIKATNRQINRLSVIAWGQLETWNGSSWVWDSAGSLNPAEQYRDVLLGEQNHDPIDPTMFDEQTILDWRQHCIDFGWSVDAIIDDMRTQDVLTLIASCGYAKPYQSDLYSVVVDKDVSGDAPIQVFSRVNTSNMKYEKAFARVPSGLVITYHNVNTDFENDQVVVDQSDPSVGITGLYENISYDGLISPAEVTARGQFDLDQINLRSTFYSFETDIESLVCRRGSLVAIQHDVLTSRAGDARIKSYTASAGIITTLVLDSKIHVEVSDTGIAIRHTDGSISTHTVSSSIPTGDWDTIVINSGPSDNGTVQGFNQTNNEYGSLVVSGKLSTVYQRMLVFSITPSKDLRASVVLVDEAQDLVRLNGG